MSTNINKTIVITGGGTGGHLKVADALIEEFSKKGVSVVFIGSKNGQDKSWFENDKRLKNTYFLDTYGVVNKNFIGKIKSLFNMVKKTIFCLKIFNKYNIEKVISVGGFSAAPATFASIVKFKCELYIHEQNSRMGKLNEVTSKFATEVFSSYLPNSIVKNYPISYEFFENGRVRNKIEKIAFFGGSQGAVFINDFALKIAPILNNMNIKIIHQTGKKDYKRVQEKYNEMNIKADVFDFTKDISKKMNEADFAISRAGASTMWELCANGLPALFIPYRYAAKDHQYYNAKFLFDEQMCFLKRENEINKEYFLSLFEKDINKISKKLVTTIEPNGAISIANIVLK